jgi:hypothetical protein
MPIIASDIKFFLSGGATNTDGNDALGGAISSTQASSSLNALFDYVTGDESAAGDTEYRCIYIKNDHPSLILYGAKLWISTNTPSTDTSAEIALGTSALSGTEQTIANEDTAPSGTTFSSAANEGAALSIGDMAAGAWKAIWIKRIVNSSAAAFNADGMTITVKGDTAA